MTHDKQRMQNHSTPPRTVMLTLVGLLMVTAWLVIHEKWTLIQLFLAFSAWTLFLILILVAWAFLSDGKEGLMETWQRAKKLFREDLMRILNSIGIKAKK
ncbi:MAG: hypothetical protein KGI54_10780 [Pseudomonadota bacterium]|nr:hypothetical protein [Pseudomonadota bacterium]